MNIITIICLILFLLCLFIPMNKKILHYHIPLAWSLLVCSIIHGILETNNTAMVTGKLAWLSLLILIIYPYILKRNNLNWKKFHISLSIIFSILVIIHIIHAIIR